MHIYKGKKGFIKNNENEKNNKVQVAVKEIPKDTFFDEKVNFKEKIKTY